MTDGTNVSIVYVRIAEHGGVCGDGGGQYSGRFRPGHARFAEAAGAAACGPRAPFPFEHPSGNLQLLDTTVIEEHLLATLQTCE